MDILMHILVLLFLIVKFFLVCLQIAGASLFGVLLSKYDTVTCLKLACGLMICTLPVLVFLSLFIYIHTHAHCLSWYRSPSLYIYIYIYLWLVAIYNLQLVPASGSVGMVN